MLTAEQIDRNTEWLLEYASAPVKYMTHRELLGTPKNSPVMKDLWKKVEEDRAVCEIFGKQNEDGSWCTGGSWARNPGYQLKGGVDPYTPKYVTTVWVLPLLARMGYRLDDSRIRKACDFTLAHGYFLDVFFSDPCLRPEDARISPCRFAQYLIGLSSVGAQEEERVQRGYEYLLGVQREDGGWALSQHIRERGWTRSCPWSTGHAAAALYQKKDKSCTGELIRALQFLVRHLSGKTPEEMCRFFYHGHNTVEEMLMVSEYRVGLDTEAVQTVMKWLMSMYRGDHFEYQGKRVSAYTQKEDAMDAAVARYRLYHRIESDWLTYDMTRIRRNLL